MLKRISPYILLLTLVIAVIFLQGSKINKYVKKFADLKYKQILPYRADEPKNPISYPLVKDAIEFDNRVPQKVRESFRSVIGITSQFKFNNLIPSFLSNEPDDSGGTGFF